MKFKLSAKLLRKLVLGMTIINGLILITYIFLLISSTVFENYFIFMLSIPAYIISNSWLLIIGLFGFEVLLLSYYWFKVQKSPTQAEAEPMLEDYSEVFNDDNLIEDLEQENHPSDLGTESAQNQIEPETLRVPVRTRREQQKKIKPEILTDAQKNQAEIEFDKLWEEAINHVKQSTDKKKSSGSPELKEAIELSTNSIEKPKNSQNKSQTHKEKPTEIITDFDFTKSRAVIPKSKIKSKRIAGNPSIIKDEHREFYNEVAINSWIYEATSDRERVGLFKLALDETRFRENDIQYMLDGRILHKYTIPFPSGSFIIYSLYESDDKKLIKKYLGKFCKQNKLSFTQKSIAFVDYADLGLERKNWRFDFFINDKIVGLIWLSDFLIADELTGTFSLTFQSKKEIKALLATSQLSHFASELQAMIITDYELNAKIIQNYINEIGMGKITILTLSDKKFKKKLLKQINI